MSNQSNSNQFAEFTNLYSLSKTLKFELKPTPTTKSYLDFTKDKERGQNYKEMKVIFDDLHREFISGALTSVDIDFGNFLVFYKDFLVARKNRKDQPKAWIEQQKEMDTRLVYYRKKVVIQFNHHGEQFKMDWNNQLNKTFLKSSGYKVLTDAGIMEVLKLQYQDNDDKLKIINSFDGFFTYFGSFNQTRENLYKDDGTVTAIATRLIDENLLRFCDNIIYWEELQKSKKENKDGGEEIIKLVDIDERFFDISYYSKCLNQNGIDLYNGTKESEDEQSNSLSLNKSKINLQLQKFYHDNKKTKASKFKELYKVMLTERGSFMTEYDEVSILGLLKEMNIKFSTNLPLIENLISDFNTYELDKIWIKNTNISKLSARFCGGQNWSLIGGIIKQLGYEKVDKENAKSDNFVPMSVIKEAFDTLASGDVNIEKPKKYKKNQDEILNTKYVAKDIFGLGYFEIDNCLNGLKESDKLWDCFVILLQNDWSIELDNYNLYRPLIESKILNRDKYEPNKETDYSQQNQVLTQANLTKKYADSVQNIWNMVRMFELFHDKKSLESDYENDSNFYNPLNTFLKEFSAFGYYNDLRNFSTKKPFSQAKFKINFDNATLLGGWDMNKEKDNTSIILKSGNKYELIILTQKYKSLFEKKKNPQMYSDQQSDWLKMEYKLLPGPNKMLPKVAFADCNKEIFKEIFDKYPRIEEIRQNETFKKDPKTKEVVNKNDLAIWIAFYQDILITQPDWKNFDWKFQEPNQYPDVSKFYRDVQVQGYKLKFIPVNNDLIDQYEQEGKLHRFQIKNKDWNEGSKGAKNLQTIYWEGLFSPDNLESPNLKLNGEGEIFQRPSSDLKKEKIITKELHRQIQNGYHSKRYIEDYKMFLHIPITLNFGSSEITKFNDYTNSQIKNPSYLGIDRGENNLLYMVLINSKGRILLQKSLNKLGDQDYADLLQAKQDERKTAKETWSVINNIKNLKEGYLSLAIHEVTRAAFDNGALIILENLNYGFKKSRTIKFEKSVYQKFEVKLATKLQYLVFKDKDINELGGVRGAVQLCPALDIKKIDKSDQWGVIKYVPAAYTSRMDPMTGWRKHIYLDDKVDNIKKCFNPDGDGTIKLKFDIREKCYYFEYLYEEKDSIANKLWKIYAHKDLIRNYYDKNETQYDTRTKIKTGGQIQEDLNRLLDKYKVSGEFDQVEMFEGLSDREWRELKYIYDLITNIRIKKQNPTKGNPTGRIDDIQSPILCTADNCIFVRNNQEFQPFFFDTRESSEINKKLGTVTPIDADANGAYHIAKSSLKY